jgi:hypothetical protein
MARLIVNPGREGAWEITLREGVNSLGRGEHNHFQINEPSVSTSHCYVIVNNGDVLIRDLGSTNGTFVNQQPVKEEHLRPGQTLRLGGVELVLEADAPPPPPPAPTPATARLRVSVHTASVPPPPAEVPSAPPPLIAPPTRGISIPGGKLFCKFHPKSVARYQCPKCNRTFCELCVTSRSAGGEVKKMCRTCGVESLPLEVDFTPERTKGFYARLPGVFVYPFKGSGILVLIVGTFVIAGLQIMSAGIFSILLKIVAYGYLFSYMQNIIHATAAEEVEMPELPGMDDVFAGFVRLAGTVLASFGVAIGLAVAVVAGVEIPVSLIIIAVILGCIYFPMAFLAVAMKDNPLAANPLIVVPSILKVPMAYLVTVILFGAIFGASQVGNLIASVMGTVTFTTTSGSVLLMAIAFRLVWSFISVYLLTINMRILGLLYLTKKEDLGW